MLVAAVLIAAALLLFIYYKFDPSTGVFFPKCPFRLVFGVPCPGCGSQRAIHSLLHANIASALKYNAFLVLCIPYLSLYLVSNCMKEKWPGLYRIANHRYIAYFFVVAVPLWWVLRLIFHLYV